MNLSSLVHASDSQYIRKLNQFNESCPRLDGETGPQKQKQSFLSLPPITGPSSKSKLKLQIDFLTVAHRNASKFFFE